MSDKYVLDETGNPVPCDDLFTWATWFETSIAQRIVANDSVDGLGDVSTVFLALDHSFGSGPPLLYETLIFGGLLDGEMRRYTTRDEATAGHAEMVERVRALAVAP